MKNAERSKLRRLQDKFLDLPVVKEWIADGNEYKKILTGHRFTANHLRSYEELLEKLLAWAELRQKNIDIKTLRAYAAFEQQRTESLWNNCGDIPNPEGIPGMVIVLKWYAKQMNGKKAFEALKEAGIDSFTMKGMNEMIGQK